MSVSTESLSKEEGTVSVVRYFTRATLVEANREAIASGRNMTLVPEKVEALPDLKFPVVTSFLHNDVERRCKVVLNEQGASVFLDVPLETYNALPTATVNADGTVEFSAPADYRQLSEVTREPTDGGQAEELETVQVYKCVECGEVSEEPGDRLYEYGDCGTRFTRDNSADGMSHRCPDCNTFSSKVADQSCLECEEGEVEEVTAYKCPSCNKLHEEEDEARSCCGGAE